MRDPSPRVLVVVGNPGDGQILLRESGWGDGRSIAETAPESTQAALKAWIGGRIAKRELDATRARESRARAVAELRKNHKGSGSGFVATPADISRILNLVRVDGLPYRRVRDSTGFSLGTISRVAGFRRVRRNP